ncbi:acetoacyl-CoA synthetase [Laetiporus sulphureus 93-53]|uniref:Acetoacyl-CoA synthetase n=1 Tax=Laetiporus sulphureus 93-53 TaxID=1314785 RepID=A0A165I8U5_9APHY|nr:acetoacyl-CoA synthetase [Laetiporus sulphureus 93-53]KZT12742.1 acetoacyl-CoA synthetase [Laetiporus sulphureus 93-53]
MDALYNPPAPDLSRTFQFLRRVNAKHGLTLSSYYDLYQWSTTNIDDFWSEVWDDTGVVGTKGEHVVDTVALPPASPPWFKEARLNWAENMLRCRSPDKTALIEAIEPHPANPNRPLRRVSYEELYSLVADLVSAFLSLGLEAGDRVASYASNCIENVAACLAATAIGCIWVSAAADFGPEGVLERFEQVQPKVVISVDGVVYNAKVHVHIPKLKTLLSGLSERGHIPQKVVVIRHLLMPSEDAKWDRTWMDFKDLAAEGEKAKLGRTPEGEIKWQRLDFNWPLWILFSSGTTGEPIVHRAGGMLLQMKKELIICADMQPEDVFFYYTTTGWMMWNWLVSGLSVGCTLVLYDGSPLRDPAYLWRLVDELRITIFGTSAKYIDQLSKSYKPSEHHKLTSLRHIYSTGSPLAPSLYDFVYEHIKRDVLLGSITGGTDICSLFAGMCTALPVFRGEVQCRLLGMAVEVFTPAGTPAKPDEAGELVCLKPFPCMPAGFWPLPGYGSEEAVQAAQARYQQAYFSEFKDVWFHGDHVILTRSRAGNGGGLIMLGRSDGVLNPGGIRFGSAEIYDVIELCFSPSTSHAGHAIVDCLVVGQSIADGTDERVILFVKLLEGQTLTPELEKKIKAEVRSRRSARHVPARIIQVRDIPYTVNMKRVEVPVKKIINGAPLSSVNPATLRNPECLPEYEAVGKALRAEMRGVE